MVIAELMIKYQGHLRRRLRIIWCKNRKQRTRNWHIKFDASGPWVDTLCWSNSHFSNTWWGLVLAAGMWRLGITPGQSTYVDNIKTKILNLAREEGFSSLTSISKHPEYGSSSSYAGIMSGYDMFLNMFPQNRYAPMKVGSLVSVERLQHAGKNWPYNNCTRSEYCTTGWMAMDFTTADRFFNLHLLAWRTWLWSFIYAVFARLSLMWWLTIHCESLCITQHVLTHFVWYSR